MDGWETAPTGPEVKMEYVVIFEEDENGCSAYVPDLPGCIAAIEKISGCLKANRNCVQRRIPSWKRIES